MQYAVGTTALQEDLLIAGADGVFDVALTNGLLAIAASVIPGHKAANPAERTPSASEVLRDLAKSFQKSIAGMVAVPTGEEATDLDDRGFLVRLGFDGVVQVPVDLLQDALNRTQPARHGRGPTGLLTSADVDALVGLDEHPALRVLTDYANDLSWKRGEEGDALEAERASEFLEMLTEEEVEARVRAVRSRPVSADDFVELQFCPVCGHQSMVGVGQDGWGYGLVAAICQVCSFKQGEHAAERESMEMEWETRWAHE